MRSRVKKTNCSSYARLVSSQFRFTRGEAEDHATIGYGIIMQYCWAEAWDWESFQMAANQTDTSWNESSRATTTARLMAMILYEQFNSTMCWVHDEWWSGWSYLAIAAVTELNCQFKILLEGVPQEYLLCRHRIALLCRQTCCKDHSEDPQLRMEYFLTRVSWIPLCRRNRVLHFRTFVAPPYGQLSTRQQRICCSMQKIHIRWQLISA